MHSRRENVPHGVAQNQMGGGVIGKIELIGDLQTVPACARYAARWRQSRPCALTRQALCVLRRCRREVQHPSPDQTRAALRQVMDPWRPRAGSPDGQAVVVVVGAPLPADRRHLTCRLQSDVYHHCPAWLMAWHYRKCNLLKELLTHRPDIMCLQVCVRCTALHCTAVYTPPHPPHT